MRTIRTALAFGLVASACASAPPAPPVPPPSFEQKVSWILRLEDRRVLRDPPPVAPPPPPAVQGRQPPIIMPPSPDLVRLLTDKEARVRRRAALAIGRVGLPEGVQPLVALLDDPDPEVRQMGAFALGLVGDARASAPLVEALADPSPLVKGSAAEALGLIGDTAAADAVARMAAAIVQSGALAETPSDDDDARRDTPASAFRLAVYALVRLRAFAPLASAVLDESGQPRVRWWPIAFALQRLEDPRALRALLTLAADPHPYTRAFAIRGLGAVKDPAAVQLLLPLVAGADRATAVEALRSLGRIGDRAAGPALLALIRSAKADPQVRLEAVLAIGGIGGEGVFDTLLDVLADRSPPIRGAALRALARIDPEGFVTVLSGLDPDSHWSGRSALAEVLGTLPPESGLPRLRTMITDDDARVIPAVLASLTALGAPEAAPMLLERLKSNDPVIRVAAANGLGRLKPAGAAPALAEAYRAGQRDTSYVARAAALAALVEYGAAVATPVLKEALTDPDWAVCVRAAALLKQLDPSSDAGARIRPAPSIHAPEVYERPHLTNPPVSTHVYLDTDRGTILIELAVLDAPLTVENFVTLARTGFFDGLTFHRVVPDFVIQGGDPRGDGEGGPGYTIRDELNQRPYLRGTVGMALDWEETGGSQFFITHSPQPHLDARYTVFGRVLEGMHIVDQTQQGDVIRRVRIWDGENPPR